MRLVHEENLVSRSILNRRAIGIDPRNMLAANQARHVFQPGCDCRRFDLNIAAQTRRLGQVAVHLLGVFDHGNFVIVIACAHTSRCTPGLGDCHRDASRKV